MVQPTCNDCPEMRVFHSTTVGFYLMFIANRYGDRNEWVGASEVNACLIHKSRTDTQRQTNDVRRLFADKQGSYTPSPFPAPLVDRRQRTAIHRGGVSQCAFAHCVISHGTLLQQQQQQQLQSPGNTGENKPLHFSSPLTAICVELSLSPFWRNFLSEASSQPHPTALPWPLNAVAV